MKKLRLLSFLSIGYLCFVSSCRQESLGNENLGPEQMMIRLAEITIDSAYADAYVAILQRESEASVQLEAGVICIYPMVKKSDPTEIRLLEIYANEDAYKSHLESEHFRTYKSSTTHMVISLKLIDMKALDPGTMDEIFKKIN